jgi:hypothetical protein
VAGYSNTPLSRKLGIKPGHRIALIGRPEGWEIEGLPADVTVRDQATGQLDLIVAFFAQRTELARDAPDLLPALVPDGSLWIAWPRRAAGHVSDIRENDLRDILLPTGVVDTKVAALDEDWSGLKFVWRKELRSRLPSPASPPATPR